ncbi:MAG TPA: hypothetical protein ENG95_01850, partial [Nitrospirae bacterium]|nr:hypothetical protein [Nitrospirota bacterium]
MDNNKRVVVTGIGPLASPGIGKDAFWQGLLDKNTGLSMKKYDMDGAPWEEFYAHVIKGFDYRKFDLDETALTYIREWKEEEPPVDLYYMMAAISLAFEDSGLDYRSDDNNIGMVLTHENMNLIPFMQKITEMSFDTLMGETGASLTRKQFYETIYRHCLKSG